MLLRQYVVDAFTDRIFHGNPAAVCVLEEQISDELKKSIAKENNLSETAFAFKKGNSYELRWFTPGGEIDLCGHATLGTAFVILNYYDRQADRITFQTSSGLLSVKKHGEQYEMDFPSYRLSPVAVTDEMEAAIGFRPLKAYMGRDLLCIFENEEIIRSIQPDSDKIKKLDGLLLHVTAQGREYDCVSRSFAPKLNVTEDPVCGSGHCHVIPYWAAATGKQELIAYQASARGGTLYCRYEGDRIHISGKAALYSKAELFVNEISPVAL